MGRGDRQCDVARGLLRVATLARDSALLIEVSRSKSRHLPQSLEFLDAGIGHLVSPGVLEAVLSILEG